MTRDDTTSNLPVRGRANSDTKAINKDNSSFPSRSGDSLQNPNSGNGKPNKHDAPSSHEAKGSGSPIVSTLKAEPKDGASISPRVGEASDAKVREDNSMDYSFLTVFVVAKEQIFGVPQGLPIQIQEPGRWVNMHW